MAIADDDIERIRSTVSIVDLVGQLVQLKRVGRNWVGLCPFHAERTPSFNVREEIGRYRCFGCDKSGDVFTFVQETQHTDFVGSVEYLANRAGIQLTETSPGQSQQRARRKRLVGAMHDAVEWYHDRLLTSSDARVARDYLRSRGLAGDIARQFKLGWAPDDWDVLARESGIDAQLLHDNGLAFRNRRNKLQDAFRGRVMFPIFTENGEAVALGGRILPGSPDPAKYKNSSETPIYTKSKTLYGLNWAKGDIVNANQVIVCEGYTDVIGFHQAGLGRAVATCGTAFTEEHVRLLKRYASRVVLAFDADAAGQGAAERFYEWEEKYQVEVSVATFPGGKDPGEMAQHDPAGLAAAVDGAKPFLGFRLGRVVDGQAPQSPEAITRLAEAAMTVINEHPNVNIRKLYAGQVAAQVGMPVSDLVQLAERGVRRPHITVARPKPAGARRENAEFVAIALLVQQWDSIATWLVEALFADDVYRRAFLAVAESAGDVGAAIDAADPEARDVLERAAVIDIDAEPEAEARNLIGAAVRRELAERSASSDAERIREDAEARRRTEELTERGLGVEAAGWLLGWLEGRMEARAGGG
ncbi:MAG: DNA primase [Ilumatobacteraceae bacterium]